MANNTTRSRMRMYSPRKLPTGFDFNNKTEKPDGIIYKMKMKMKIKTKLEITISSNHK